MHSQGEPAQTEGPEVSRRDWIPIIHRATVPQNNIMFILYKYILSSTYLKGNHEKIVDLTVLSNKEKAQLLRHNLNKTSKPYMQPRWLAKHCSTYGRLARHPQCDSGLFQPNYTS